MGANIVSEIFSYGFMQNAILVGLVLSIMLPVVGIIVYLRKIIFLSDTLGQVSLAGASFAVFLSTTLSLSINNDIVIIIWTIIGAIFIQFLIDKIKDYQEVSLMITHSVSICLVMILLSQSGGYSSTIFSLLFGNIVGITSDYVVLIAVSSVIVLVILAILYRKILISILDQKQSHLRGINPTFYKYLTIVLISIIISLAIKVVGVMLVATMLCLPILVSNLISRSLKQTVIYSIIVCLISFIGGIIISFYYNISGSAIIVLIVLVLYLITSIYKFIQRKVYGTNN